MLSRYDTLKLIQGFDPDGWETEPKPEDYTNFRGWVISQYGKEVWQEYCHGSWETASI